MPGDDQRVVREGSGVSRDPPVVGEVVAAGSAGPVAVQGAARAIRLADLLWHDPCATTFDPFPELDERQLPGRDLGRQLPALLRIVDLQEPVGMRQAVLA